jgi:pimeloyl-ACP methyl ester carboxylesterase
MKHLDQPLARRAIIKGAGLGLVAGALADTLPAKAASEGGEIWSSEYWAKKGDIPLWMYRKRVGAPKAGEPSRPVLFFVHGSSVSSRVFDLNVPGHGEYSVMDEFARYGFDCWTMDHENYGKSGRTSGNADIASGVEDLKAAMPVVTKETGQQKAHFYGTSSGGIRATAYAQAQPERVGRLVLSAFTYKGNGAAEIERRRKRIDELRANPRRKRDAAMIRSIFTRDGYPSAYDPAMIDALIADEMKFGDQIPSGTYLDMAANLPIVDPKKILSPVLMLRGEFDGNSTNDDLIDFYRQLPNGHRQFVILPQIAHSAGYSKNRHLLYYAVHNFLAAPAPTAA